MNIFKGLLFLHGYVSPAYIREFDADPTPRREFGAHTAAAELAAPLGNAVESRRWFGAANPVAHPQAGCIAGGCG